ncbi:MAG: hypothetical protein K6A65_02835 [Succinivibrionaceae bacterium]|nr:hypothetical protein [Succinivibrionaceae bacterium]
MALDPEPPRNGDFAGLIESLSKRGQQQGAAPSAMVDEKPHAHESVAESFARLKAEIASGTTVGDINAANAQGELLNHEGHHHNLYEPRHDYAKQAKSAAGRKKKEAGEEVETRKGYLPQTLLAIIAVVAVTLGLRDVFAPMMEEDSLYGMIICEIGMVFILSRVVAAFLNFGRPNSDGQPQKPISAVGMGARILVGIVVGLLTIVAIDDAFFLQLDDDTMSLVMVVLILLIVMGAAVLRFNKGESNK